MKEKGASSWLSVIPLKEMNFTLNKREFRDAIKLRYGWEFNDIPTVCVCGDFLTLTMLWFVWVEDILYNGTTKFEISRLKFCKLCVLTSKWSRFSKKLRGKYLSAAEGFQQGPWPAAGYPCADIQSAFFDVRVCHPNADSYKNLIPEQIYKLHENDKRRLYSSRVLEVERGTFTPFVFTTTRGISNECQRYHSRLAELLAVKKQESYASTIAWIRTRVSFAILRSALVCLRGSRSRRRTIPNIQESDLELGRMQIALSFWHWVYGKERFNIPIIIDIDLKFFFPFFIKLIITKVV